VLADRDEGFGEPQPGVEQRLSAGSSGAPAAVPPFAKSTYGRPASVHIPAAISPYGPATAPVGVRPKTKVASTEHKISGAKAAATMNPPLPPPAPREAAKAEEPGPPTSKPADNHESDQTHADIVPPAVAPTTTGSSAEGSDKSKVSIVPPALFE
jgi:hypothetical protein